MLAAMAAPVLFAPLDSAARDEISIVGAGPAGLACAIVLARAGRRVVVHEHQNRVGARFHGDFQGLDNWTGDCDVLDELRAHGIESNFEHHPVRGGVAFDAWGRSYPYTSSAPIYYLVKRGSDPDTLDCGLLRQAIHAGADVRFGHRHSANNVRVISCGPRAADVIAVGYLFQTDLADGAWICFNRELAPLGYSYLLVHRGYGTVASCIFEDFKREHLFLERTVDFFRRTVGLRMESPRKFGGYGNYDLPKTGVEHGSLLLGERAGFQDPLAGFGIRYAIRSGILAAQSLLEGTNYNSLWRHELMQLLRTGLANRFFVNLTGDHGWRWILAHRLATDDVCRTMRKLYRPTMLTRTLYPLALLLHRFAKGRTRDLLTRG
jgi:flavin-dependent dehydrogenase